MLATQKGRSNPVRISSKRWEKFKHLSCRVSVARAPRPRSISTAKAVSYFLCRQSRHTDHFISACVAGCNSNGGTRYLQKFRKEIHAGIVRFALRRRRQEGKFQRLSCFAGDGILLRARMDFDRESSTGRRVLDSHHRKARAPGRVATSRNPTIYRYIASSVSLCAPWG